MTWERKLAAAFFLIALLIALSTCYAAVPQFPLADPICPTHQSIAQRYDEWKRVNGQIRIVKSTWIRKCVKVRMR